MSRVTPTVLVAVAAASLLGAPAQPQDDPLCAGAEEASRWPPELDAMRAAPETHRVLYEDDQRRILEITVLPGEQQRVHDHPWPSVLVIDGYPSYVTRDRDGREIAPVLPRPENPRLPAVARLGPEAGHSIENTGALPFHAIRIEFKKRCVVK